MIKQTNSCLFLFYLEKGKMKGFTNVQERNALKKVGNRNPDKSILWHQKVNNELPAYLPILSSQILLCRRETNYDLYSSPWKYAFFKVCQQTTLVGHCLTVFCEDANC